MASGGDDLEQTAVQQIVQVQVDQLQAALRETQAIAAKQGHGVRVVWSKAKDVSGKMNADMYVDREVEQGFVRFVEVDPQ